MLENIRNHEMLSSLGFRAPGKANLPRTLGRHCPAPCPHLLCGVFFEIDSFSLLEFSKLFLSFPMTLMVLQRAKPLLLRWFPLFFFSPKRQGLEGQDSKRKNMHQTRSRFLQQRGLMPKSEPKGLGCTPRGSCNNTLFRRVLRRFFTSRCFLECACKCFQ